MTTLTIRIDDKLKAKITIGDPTAMVVDAKNKTRMDEIGKLYLKRNNHFYEIQS